MQVQYQWLASSKGLLKRSVMEYSHLVAFLKRLGYCGKGIKPHGYAQGKP